MKRLLIFVIAYLSLENNFAQQYLTIDDCLDLYARGFYDEIYPSLEHIKDEIENSPNFDAQTYTVVSILLSRVEFDCYGDGNKASQILYQSYKTLKSNTGNSNETRIMIVKLAENYRILRQLGKAKAFLDKANEMYNEAGDYGQYYLTLLVQNSIYYYLMDEKDNMKESVEQIIKIYQKLYGDIFSSTDYKGLNILNNIALIYNDLGETDKAEQCYLSIINNLQLTDVMSNDLHTEACNALAVIKMQQQKWQEAMDILLKIKWYQNRNNDIYTQNFLTCSLFLGDRERIDNFFKIFNLSMLIKMPQIFFKTNEENYNYVWYENLKNIEFYNFAAYKSNISNIIKESYISTAFFKTVSLKSNKLLDDYVRTSDDEQLKSDYYQSREMKKQYIFGRSSIDDKMQAYLEYERLFDSVLTKVPNLSQKLLTKLQSFAESKDALYENEYAVEFCIIPVYDSVPNHKDYYGAYIIGRDYSVPKLIKLASIKDVNNLLTPTNDEILYYSQLYSKDNANKLYQLLFKPLAPFLNNAKTIYYSPYGMLSTLNFDVLSDDNGLSLTQKYKLVRVSSTLDINTVRVRNILTSKSAALYGNINYDTSFYDSSRGSTFGRLKNADKEINSISDILKNHNIISTIYDHSSATEESFKNLSGKAPDILHFATHGFCFETDEKAADKPFAQNVKSYSQKESAMILSGLALSGANNIWKGKFNLQNIEDGILTAYEISQLDLSNTRLAVLSACETAKGRIFPVDGVFGLQRAFKQAGAGAILMSLWKVNDAATSLFMQHFYKSLMQTGDRHKALNFARNEVKKDFPDPYYWAAWVLLD